MSAFLTTGSERINVEEKNTHQKKASRRSFEDAAMQNVFLFFFPAAAPFLMQKIGETDGTVSNHDNCSWPQLMIANNPNECYTIFKIAILLPAHRLAENVNCYANRLSGHK